MKELAICVPVRNEVSTPFALSLALLSARLERVGVDFTILFVNGSMLPSQRQTLAEQSSQIAEYTLWIDSDMQVPDDIYERLRAHNKDVVACTYSTRTEPCHTVAFTDLSTLEVQRLETHDGGTYEVEAVGMGCMLMKNTVLDNLPKPWFSFGYHVNIDQFTGEDVFFCELLREFDYKIYVDTDISKAVYHYGIKGYSLDDINN